MLQRLYDWPRRHALVVDGLFAGVLFLGERLRPETAPLAVLGLLAAGWGTRRLLNA